MRDTDTIVRSMLGVWCAAAAVHLRDAREALEAGRLLDARAELDATLDALHETLQRLDVARGTLDAGGGCDA